jgi:hypothetical protein
MRYPPALLSPQIEPTFACAAFHSSREKSTLIPRRDNFKTRSEGQPWGSANASTRAIAVADPNGDVIPASPLARRDSVALSSP